MYFIHNIRKRVMKLTGSIVQAEPRIENYGVLQQKNADDSVATGPHGRLLTSKFGWSGLLPISAAGLLQSYEYMVGNNRLHGFMRIN